MNRNANKSKGDESRVARTSGFEVCGLKSGWEKAADLKSAGPRYALSANVTSGE